MIEHVGGIVEKSAPVNDDRRRRSTSSSTRASPRSRACSSRRPGCADAVGLVEGIYPGAAAAGLRDFPESTTVDPPRIGEVYTKGTLTLARLGREAPIAAASPAEGVLRNVEGGSLAARSLYPDGRQTGPEKLPTLAGHRHRRARAVRAARGHRSASQAAPGQAV